MKKLAGLFLLLALLSAAGCLTLPTAPWQPPPAKPAEAEPLAATPPVVQPDQVTPQTAQDAVQALRTELEHDARKGKR